jgi:hypothetical protein
LHSDQDSQLRKHPFEARLEALQIARTLELGRSAIIQDREHHDAILNDLWVKIGSELRSPRIVGVLRPKVAGKLLRTQRGLRPIRTGQSTGRAKAVRETDNQRLLIGRLPFQIEDLAPRPDVLFRVPMAVPAPLFMHVLVGGIPAKEDVSTDVWQYRQSMPNSPT